MTMPYVLTREETSPGRFTVRRYLWVEFPAPGEWVRDAGTSQVIASNLTDKGSKRIAQQHVEQFPGHTATPPTAVASERMDR
jgi:hypothetical protein